MARRLDYALDAEFKQPSVSVARRSKHVHGDTIQHPSLSASGQQENHDRNHDKDSEKQFLSQGRQKHQPACSWININPSTPHHDTPLSSLLPRTTDPPPRLSSRTHPAKQHPSPSHTMISGIHHINLTVPADTLHLAHAFYAETLGLTPRPVPALQRSTLAWFDIGASGQQVHIAFGKPEDFAAHSSRHPCFRVAGAEELLQLRKRVYEHFLRGGEAAPVQADKPGEESSGAKGVEYPTRFFARDYAGNRLEFSL